MVAKIARPQRTLARFRGMVTQPEITICCSRRDAGGNWQAQGSVIRDGRRSSSGCAVEPLTAEDDLHGRRTDITGRPARSSSACLPVDLALPMRGWAFWPRESRRDGDVVHSAERS